MGRQKWFLAVAAAVLAAGAAATAELMRNRPVAETAPPAVEGRLVRAIPVKKQSKTFWVTGYGTVRPKIEIEVVPEVSGRVARRAPGFRSGGFVRKGDLLFEIDPSDYRLAVAQRRAQIAQLEADIARLLQEGKNHRAELAISRRHLAVVRQELERNRKLRRQGVISQGQYDVSLQAFLRQERTVQGSESALALIPPQLAQKRAALSVTRAQLEEALLNLKRTRYHAPFDARVRAAGIDAGDYVQAGRSYGKIYDMTVVEVPVPIPIGEARWAFRRVQGVSFPKTQEEVQRFFPAAAVLWSRFGKTFRWDGRVTLVESELDEATRTLTLVVEVPEPLKNWVPGKYPPLVVGMFVRVRIQGISLPGVFVVPRAAVRRGDRVFLLRSGKLEIRPVQVVRKTQDEAVIQSGLREGERIILSAIPDPVPGMKLRTANGGGRGGDQMAERPAR